jgi:hypothetical protein
VWQLPTLRSTKL